MWEEDAREFSELLEWTVAGVLKFSTKVESELNKELFVPRLCLFVDAKPVFVAETGVGAVVVREELEYFLEWKR